MTAELRERLVDMTGQRDGWQQQAEAVTWQIASDGCALARDK